jgi:hypothetical protein
LLSTLTSTAARLRDVATQIDENRTAHVLLEVVQGLIPFTRTGMAMLRHWDAFVLAMGMLGTFTSVALLVFPESVWSGDTELAWTVVAFHLLAISLLGVTVIQGAASLLSQPTAADESASKGS